MDSELKNNLRQHLRKTCSAIELKRWYDPLRVELDEERGEVSVLFPHAFFGAWFAGAMRERFEAEVHGFLGSGLVIRYGSNGRGHDTAEHPVIEETRSVDFPFGPEFTFSSFIENRKNYFPLTSAREVARQTDVEFNPFIISGPAGCGKTHLVKAVANEMAGRFGREAVFCASLEELCNLYEGTFGGDYFKARSHVCSHRFLVVDDFQLVGRHRAFQAELINLFDSFYNGKRQMIFCCADNLPSYEFLDPKLKSRLEWGLIVTLKEPDLEVRVRYVERFCTQKRLPLSRDRILTLAQRFTDLRFLQGLLLKVYAYREFVHADLSDRDFDRILSQTAGGVRSDMTPEAVLDIVAAAQGLERKDLTGLRRHQNIVQARQMAMFLCRELLGCSYPALGRIFGGRDHSTALYAVRKVRKSMSEDMAFRDKLEALRKKCESGD